MILGIGIDSAEIVRFENWHTYKESTLLKVFSPHELTYCMNIPAKRAERFAVRFALKEAFYKALCMWQPQHRVPFLTICKNIELYKTIQQAPNCKIEWDVLKSIYPAFLPMPLHYASMTHTKTTATAVLILEKP